MSQQLVRLENEKVVVQLCDDHSVFLRMKGILKLGENDKYYVDGQDNWMYLDNREIIDVTGNTIIMR